MVDDAWQSGFLATAIAVGATVDEALLSIAPGAAATELASHLRAPQRAARAAALVDAVRDVVIAAGEATLR